MSATTTINRKASDGRKPKPGLGPTARALGGAFLLQVVLSCSARAGDDRWNWSYCAPPYPPACVEAVAKDPDASSKPADKPSRDQLTCEQAVERYVASVFAYRVCLTNEMERAVREANSVLQVLKCPRDKRYCYNLPQPDSSPLRKPGDR